MKRVISLKRKKKYLKKIKYLLVIIGFIGGILGIKMVNAGINDSKMEKNRMEGIYAVTKINGVDRIFYLNMYTLSGRIAYCIEIGVDMDTDIYNSTYDFSISNLSSSQINYIKNISYFGYGYAGHSDYRYYMAAQELIWEYLSGVSIEWTNELSVDGTRIDIETYKNSILRYINAYNKGVNLRGYTKDRKINIGSDLVLTDFNNNLKYYEIVSSEHIDSKIVGNLIDFSFDDDYVGMDSVFLRRKRIYNYDSLLYYQGVSQKLISNGNIDDKIELSFNIIGMNISFLIVDNSGIKNNNQYNFEGIEYEFVNENGEVLEVLKVDEFGKILVSNLPYSKKYCIRQTKTNEAYRLNDDNYCFEFNENTGVIYLEVEPILSDLELLKLYGDNDDLKEEEGALFDIYNLDGSLYDSVKTDEKGIAKLKLPYGEYIIKQISGKDGYYMSSDFEVDAKGEKELKYTLVNEFVKTNLVINSKNSDEDIIVSDSDIYYKIKDKNSGNYLVVDGVSEFQNIDGKVLIPEKLGYGKYVIEVINKSMDYKEVVKVLEIVIDDTNSFNLIGGELYLEVDFLYELTLGNVKIITSKEKFISKDSSYYYEYVRDGEVKLKLLADEDIIVNNKVVYKNGSEVIGIKTDAKGEYIIDKIYMGSYCIVDEFDNKECFVVDTEDVIEVELKKNLKKGSVNIHNVSNKLDDIEDSVIELYDKDNNLIFIGITNEEGLIRVNDLIYGDYCLSQKSINNKYIINDDKVCFSINNSELLDVEIVNESLSKKLIEIPNTFSSKQNINRLVVVILVIIGGILYKVKGSNSCK